MDESRKLKYCPICGDVLYDPIWNICLKHDFEPRYQSRLHKLTPPPDEQDP
ncbi:MAG: hypothetical protein ACXACH_05395 [Candidatus Hermodarchaeia archaeon]